MLCRIAYMKLVLCILLFTVVWDGVAAGKKKKVIIKVPTHVKHVYHHHLKTVHIQRPQPKPQHHVHHDHFEDVHNDRDDYRGKRHGKGFGSWRGLEAEAERPRGYRSYTDLMKERPPPAPKGEYDDPEYRSTDQELRPSGWRATGGKSSSGWKGGGGKGGWRSNKGVVYEQNHKGKWQPSAPDDYDGPDLTYGTKGFKDSSNEYGSNNGGKSYGNDYGSNNGGQSYNNDYGSSNGGKSYGNDYESSNGVKNYGNDYGLSNGGRSYSNDYSHHEYKSEGSAPNYRAGPIKGGTPHRFNPKTFRDYDSKDVTNPDVNYHGLDSDKREVRVAPTQGIQQVSWPDSSSNIKSNHWKSPTTSSIPSVWPEIKEHSSWTQNPSYTTTLPPYNNLPDLSHSNPGTASSYVYHNFGSADGIVAQHQGSAAISPTVNNVPQVTIRPLSSYQVQVNHYTERPVRP